MSKVNPSSIVESLKEGGMDSLEYMFELQLQLAEVCGVFHLDHMAALQEVVSAAAVEANEALAPFITKTKPWKLGKPIDLEHVDEEMTDVFFFIMEYFILRGKDWKEFLAGYVEKHQTNLERIKKKIEEVHGR